MSYVPDYVREAIGQSFLWGSLAGGLCAGLVRILLSYLQRYDEELEIRMGCRGHLLLCLVGIAGGSMVFFAEAGNRQGQAKGVLMLLYLLLCSVTDLYMQQVYDAVQLYVCGGLAIMTFFEDVSPSLGAEVIIFALIQGLVFRRMYGEGDVMGFLICALSLMESGILVWTLHMGMTYLLLGLVQGAKQNIGRDGNLKVAVPLFPYMSCAYAFVFLCRCCAKVLSVV